MADVPELSSLFSKLASSLHRSASHKQEDKIDNDEEEEGPDAAAAISSLAASLNPTQYPSSSSSRVLDAVLSLMCYKAPEVWSSNVKWLVESITTVVSSSVSCKVIRHESVGKKSVEWLMVGCSIPFGDCEKLVRACVDVLERLDGQGFSHPLMRTVMRAAVSAPRYQRLLPLSTLYYQRNELPHSARIRLGLKLGCFLSEESQETSISCDEIPLRVLLWYLDPLALRSDISKILWDVMHRPYLHMKNKLHETMAWRVMIICLVTSPTMFRETRELLHNWFLATGLATVLELQIALVSSVLDMLSRPMRWGLTMEMGLKLPFPHAYFPNEHHELLAILSGPISCGSFLQLVHLIGVPSVNNANQLKFTASQHANTCRHLKGKSTLVDINSTWAMLMCFPCWFYFALVLVFCRKDSHPFGLESSLSRAVEIEQRNDLELCHVAAMYLALILSPFDQDCQSRLADCINETSKSWPAQGKADCASQQGHHLETHSHRKSLVCHSKKLRKLNSTDCYVFQKTADRCSVINTKFWIQQFHENFTKFYYKIVNNAPNEVQMEHSVGKRSNMLVTKVSLGILIGSPNYLDEEGCELLLHYAATGEILQLDETPISRTELISMKNTCHNNTAVCSEVGNSSKWLCGASLVLYLFDIVQDMTCAIFDTEDVQLEYICQLKGKTVGYLVRCMRNILKFQEDNERDVILIDLFNRLVQWKQQGREIFEGYKAFSDALDEFRRKIAVPHMMLLGK